MGLGQSKKEPKPVTPKAKPMPYKRQFSSEAARNNQNTMYHDYRHNTADSTDKKTAPIQEEETKQSLEVNPRKPDVLDPTKYQPPPSPLITDTAPPTQDVYAATLASAQQESIKEDDESDSMTDAQALQIKKNTARGLRPGINLLSHEEEDEKSESSGKAKLKDSIRIPQADEMIKQVSDHGRIGSVELNAIASPLLWGYCEMSRKRLDEDQAAFLTWTHPKDGFVHSWAVFDGHGGFETALYSAQHFLKYVQKHHLMHGDMELSRWPALLKEMFLKFDQHIGSLHIRGGSTVVVVLLIGKHIICANAGDARAIMCKDNGRAVELSRDHSPMDDYDRLIEIARNKENYKKIGKFFRLNGKNESYADIQKLSSSEMKKAPFISREQDKSRLLGTIGVARGFGDFTLTVFGFRALKLKPYLSADPYVVMKELKEEEILDTDIMCIACDGIYDVMTNQEVIDTLRKEIFYRKLTNIEEENQEKKVLYADEPNLNFDCDRIDRACGCLGLKSYAKGTMDDVTVFTVPLKQIFAFYKQNEQ
eukprot:533720_1